MKLAISPIGWCNDDLPELGAHISFAECIQEMEKAGFVGCEVGHKFPRDPVVLKEKLQVHGLEIASAWLSLYFTEPDRYDETVQSFIKHMQFLKQMNAKVIVVCECGNSIHGMMNQSLFSESCQFHEKAWTLLLKGLAEIGNIAAQENMRIVYHHHMGTGISHQNEIDFLMAETDPRIVSLLLDTGHLAVAGVDAMHILSRYIDRIYHIHLKDVRREVLQQVRLQNLSFLTGVKMGMFTVPGDGMIDFAPIIETLKRINYQGWLVVEAEQDPLLAHPLTYAKMAREYLESLIAS